ncbi:vomeronasal 1 receptor ornAnaV1R3181 [Ornithorhynchus anatinus]|uniref:Vomeronasal type-1 receptor n=1 Tax=Ornithorhynchus anatinus TaxID=9258 RepID=A0A6I8NYU4_ORNAN|nr:vomeronasal 1 receptor ornAnaV1R3181 [Ornithorhynchus anatinus]
MNATEISFGLLMLLQISIGVSVNVLLLLFYIHIVSKKSKSSSSDLILAQLALANSIILLTLGITETLSAWGMRKFLDDVGCKIIIYLYRVARGLAICTTCLLSVFQAVTISPGTSWWVGIKAKLPKTIFPACVLSWVINMMIDCDILMTMTGPQNCSSVQIILDLKYCSRVGVSAETTLVIAVVISLRDLFFVGIMIVASTYMVFVLHRHHRQVRHLHKSSHAPRAMPEVRAAKRVIALVILYVLLYGRQSIMLSILLNMKENSPLLVSSHMVLSFSFPAISPFLMIHNDRRMKPFQKREYPISFKDSPTGPQGNRLPSH